MTAGGKKTRMRFAIKWWSVPLISLFCAKSIWCGTVYNTLPDPSVPDEFSIGYFDNAVAEFGALIQLSGDAPANVQSATVAFSNWAFESNYESVGASAGYSLPVTLNFYDIGPSDSLGPLFYSISTSAFIPWRPEPDPTDCGQGSTDYLAGDGSCYPGALSNVNFDLGGIAFPSTFIYGLAFNTQSYGYSPLGAPGPYDQLHLAISGDPPAVGSNPLADILFWNTSIASNYHDGGAGGVGTFRPDSGWAPFSPAIDLEAVSEIPELSTFSLVAFPVFGLFAVRIRRASTWRLAASHRK